MKRSTSIFLGLLAVFLTSWLALVLVPYVQLGRMLPDIDDTTRDETPAAFSGLAEQGRKIYAADGCVRIGCRRLIGTGKRSRQRLHRRRGI